jgi:hypothetical protein
MYFIVWICDSIPTQAYTQHFPILSSSFNEIEQFLYDWGCKLEDYNCSISTKSKGAKKKMQEEKGEG